MSIALSSPNTNTGKIQVNGVDRLTIASDGILASSTSPAQFDNSTKLATTEFVQNSLGNLAGVVTYTSSATLSTSDAGKIIWVDAGAGAITLALPSSAPIGSVFKIMRINNTVNAVTVTTSLVFQGPNNFNGAANVTSINLIGYDLLEVIFTGNAWMAINGHGSASLGINGYQKFSSGLIIQWGANIVTGSNVINNVALPIAFPTAFLQSVASCVSTGSFGGTSGVNLSTIGLWANNTGAAIQWVAIGN